MQINEKLTAEVNLFLEAGDRSFLETMKELDRDSLEGQAVIRFLMQKKHWPFTPDSDFSEALTHFFAAYPDRKTLEPAEYQAKTFTLIKDAWNYECVVVVPEPRAESKEESKPKPRKASSRKTSTTRSQEAPDTDIDTTGASDRLKSVIAIQRGN